MAFLRYRNFAAFIVKAFNLLAEIQKNGDWPEGIFFCTAKNCASAFFHSFRISGARVIIFSAKHDFLIDKNADPGRFCMS